MRSDRGWRIEAAPRSPGKPIIQLFSFSDDIVSEEDAMSLAQREIDKVLES
jgi:hypothetical protein